MKNIKLILVIATALALGVVVVIGLRDIERFGTGAPAGSGNQPGAEGSGIQVVRFVKNPQPVPAFTVQDLDGTPLSTADWRGKVVLVNFWATWCPPCVAEIPDLVRLQQTYKDQLLVVGLSQDTGPAADVKAFVEKMKINYPVAIVGPEIEQKFGGILGLPTSFVVDTQGRVVQKHIGLRDPAIYDAEIRVLLDMPTDIQVEEFEDTGQVMLANAKNATDLPGVDLSKLSAEQRRAALRRFNEEHCPCGCGLTLAQCRVNDSACEVSRATGTKIVEEMLAGKAPAP
jgi:thiol-disulfide isomerase/thioredoxin